MSKGFLTVVEQIRMRAFVYTNCKPDRSVKIFLFEGSIFLKIWVKTKEKNKCESPSDLDFINVTVRIVRNHSMSLLS